MLHEFSFQILETFFLNFQMKDMYHFRAEEKKWFCHKSPYEHEEFLNKDIQAILHDRDEKGRRVCVVKLGE